MNNFIELTYITPDCIQLRLTKEGLYDLNHNAIDGELNWLLDELVDYTICLANEINDGYGHWLIDNDGNIFEFCGADDMTTLKETAISDTYPPLELNMFQNIDNLDLSDPTNLDFYNWFYNKTKN